MNKRIKYLPIEKFLLVTGCSAFKQPDPVPKELLVAVLLFLITAFIPYFTAA